MPKVFQAQKDQVKKFDQQIREEIRNARLALGMSQTDMAKTVGCSEKQWQNLENGSKRMTTGTLYAISKVLKINFFELCGSYEDTLIPSNEDSPTSNYHKKEYDGRRIKHYIETIKNLNIIKNKKMYKTVCHLIRHLANSEDSDQHEISNINNRAQPLNNPHQISRAK